LNPAYLKKKEYVDRGFFSPSLPHPQQDIHGSGSIGAFRKISEILKIIFYLPLGRHSGGAEHWERDEILE
jgi:hypothetical protein